MSHSGYILAAYLAAAFVVAGLTLWVVLDGRAQQRKLRQLEAEGVRRRSDPGKSDPGGSAEFPAQSGSGANA